MQLATKIKPIRPDVKPTGPDEHIRSENSSLEMLIDRWITQPTENGKLMETAERKHFVLGCMLARSEELNPRRDYFVRYFVTKWNNHYDQDKVTKEAVWSLMRAIRLSDQLGGVPRDLFEFYDGWAQHVGITMTLSGRVKNPRPFDDDDDGDLQVSDIEKRAVDGDCAAQWLIVRSQTDWDENRVAGEMLEFFERNDVGSILRVSKELTKERFRHWLSREKQRLIGELTLTLAYDRTLREAAEVEWRHMAGAVIGEPDDAELAVCALKHFCWQVKRKIRRLPVEYHMMPLSSGEQEAGKSSLVRLFLAPLGEAWGNTNFAQIADDRHWESFSWCFAGLLDEMQFALKADIDSVKNFITSDMLNYRVLGSHHKVRIRNNMTLIGTSNKRLQSLIDDPTGSRRFYEIIVKSPMDWDTLNGIDYMLLWRSVDENRPSPLMQHKEAIRDRQYGQRSRSLVEEWMDEAGADAEALAVGTHGTTRTEHIILNDYATPSELHERFVCWARLHGHNQTGINQWGHELSRLSQCSNREWIVSRRMPGRGVRRGWKISRHEENT